MTFHLLYSMAERKHTAGKIKFYFNKRSRSDTDTSFVKARKSTDVCEECAEGYYQDNTGQTTCNICPERYFCPWPDEPPVPCGPKEICPAGSWKPLEECKGLYKRNNETEECELSSIVYIIIGVVLSVIVAGVVFVAVRRHRRDNEQRQRLLERQHPVYTGW